MVFQPNPKPIIPAIIRAKVPIWLLVGLLAAQYVISNTNSQVHLKDMRTVAVSGNSDKPNPMNCRISAK